MSATGRGAVRLADDAYETPSWCVEAFIKDVASVLPIGDFHSSWLEPCAGRGAIIRAVNSYTGTKQEWMAVEKNPAHHDPLVKLVGSAWKVRTGDFFSLAKRPQELLGQKRFDVCMMNPPYSTALAWIRACRPLADTLVVLLRLNFLGSQVRREFFRADMPSVYVLSKRPSFTGGKTDATEYAWMVWTQEERSAVGGIAVL